MTADVTVTTATLGFVEGSSHLSFLLGYSGPSGYALPELSHENNGRMVWQLVGLLLDAAKLDRLDRLPGLMLRLTSHKGVIDLIEVPATGGRVALGDLVSSLGVG